MKKVPDPDPAGQKLPDPDPHPCISGRGLMFAQQLAKRILEDYGKEITLLLSSQNTDIQVDLFLVWPSGPSVLWIDIHTLT